jgi:glycosyltransferase involved in cell wall biosynthesis
MDAPDEPDLPVMPSGRPLSLLLNVLGSGGAQRRIATLANRFVELGHAVDIVSVEPGGPMRTMLAPEVRVVTLVPSDGMRGVSNAIHARRLTRYIEEMQPRVLMSCVTDTHLLAVAASGSQGRQVPLVLRASRHPYRPLPRWNLPKRAIEPINLRKAAFCYAHADAIVALTDDTAAGLRRLLGRGRQRIETIPNPVVAATLLDQPNAPVLRPINPVPIILGVGRLVEQKDFVTLLRAFALLRAERPAQLVLLGQGPLAGGLRALSETLGIAADVDMPGEVNDVAARMRCADLVVSSSLWEGLQATLIEAMAVGCPVVATDCPGGARETLEDGRIGPLVPVRDPARLARAMAEQLDRPTDPLTLATAAARFTPAGKAEAYLALFDEVHSAFHAR